MDEVSVPNDRQKNTDNGSQKGKRKRLLNVIYFIDSNRTHSFKLSVNAAVWMAASLGLIICLGIGSSIWLMEELNNQKHQNQRISTLLSTIFEYQVRYDQVYERTYPQNIQNKKGQDLIVDAEKKVEPKKEPPKSEVQPKLAQKPKKPEPPKKKQKPVAAKKSASKSIITIENPVYKLNKKGLVVTFAIKNPSKGIKAEGYLWGIATYIDQNGDRKIVTAPSNLGPHKNGIPEHIRAAPRFGIRYFKSKSLKFKYPPSIKKFNKVDFYVSTGKSTSILKTIYLKDEDSDLAKGQFKASPGKESTQ